jgi:hypothetical protein|eukprot:COSAG01_NODE_34771_length_542_cov_1.243792_1_plen_71_part_00
MPTLTGIALCNAPLLAAKLSSPTGRATAAEWCECEELFELPEEGPGSVGESKRLVIEPPWLQFTSECQRF